MDTLRRNIKFMDFTLIAILMCLGLYSCVALLAATHGKSVAVGVPTHILVKQIGFEVLGLIVMVGVSAFDYRNLRRMQWWIIGSAGFLLLVVFGMPSRQGAHSWIPMGPFSFQPSEFAKLALIIGIACFMANIDESEVPEYGIRKIWPIAVMFVIPFVLILAEPALGQALVLLPMVLTMYTVFARRSHFVLILTITGIVVAALCVIATLYPEEAKNFILNDLVKHHLLKAFQAYRIVTWLDPSSFQQSYGYNVRMAQIAIGSGQVFGLGFLGGIETNGNWIPNQWTDYIFTAIGEEFGFVGASLLVLLFLLLVYRLIRLATTSQDTFGTYVIVGVVGMFAFQVFENIGAVIYLSPSTGITLPFISYGGSSLLANYIAAGLALSVGLRRRKLRFN